MSTPRDIRRLAFQVLYQMDARRDEAPETLLNSVMLADEEHSEGAAQHVDYSAAERKKAFVLASQAFAAREQADAFMREAAPDWPTHRQAAVDRAILRLAYYEMTSGETPPKIAVNEAVELAKLFSTEKSPAFVNGLLDRVLKHVLAGQGGQTAQNEPGESAADSDSGSGGAAPVTTPPVPEAPSTSTI